MQNLSPWRKDIATSKVTELKVASCLQMATPRKVLMEGSMHCTKSLHLSPELLYFHGIILVVIQTMWSTAPVRAGSLLRPQIFALQNITTSGMQ